MVDVMLVGKAVQYYRNMDMLFVSYGDVFDGNKDERPDALMFDAKHCADVGIVVRSTRDFPSNGLRIDFVNRNTYVYMRQVARYAKKVGRRKNIAVRFLFIEDTLARLAYDYLGDYKGQIGAQRATLFGRCLPLSPRVPLGILMNAVVTSAMVGVASLPSMR